MIGQGTENRAPRWARRSRGKRARYRQAQSTTQVVFEQMVLGNAPPAAVGAKVGLSAQAVERIAETFRGERG